MKGYEGKNCFYCSSKIVPKDGFEKGEQRYKCGNCRKYFIGSKRLNSFLIWADYHEVQ